MPILRRVGKAKRAHRFSNAGWWARHWRSFAHPTEDPETSSGWHELPNQLKRNQEMDALTVFEGKVGEHLFILKYKAEYIKAGGVVAV